MSSQVLIAVDGSVRGLLAMAVAAREVGVGQVVCLGGVAGAPAPERLGAAKAQADLFEHRFLERRRQGTVWSDGAGEQQARELLELGYLALREGLTSVDWCGGATEATDAGEDAHLKALSGLLGRALLVERLVGLDQADTAKPMRVRAPLADLSDRQIADLVLDMDLPIWLCWWWNLARGPRNEPGAEAARAEYARWEGLLKEAGWKDGMPGPTLVAHRSAARH